MNEVNAAPVRRTITVPTSQRRAFEIFTAEFGTWWPKELSIGESDMADFIVEPRAGGRWYELGVDGKECEIGRVLAYEPPARLVVAWHLTASFQFDADPGHASEFEVRFIAEDRNSTRVELEHRGFERHGDGARGVHGAVDSPQGWGYCLARYVERVSADG